MDRNQKILGCDVSSWNYGDPNVERFIREQAEFIAIKATEGKTYVNPYVGQFVQMAVESDIKEIILYHFARPDKNAGGTVLGEVNNFMTVFKGVAQAYPDFVFIPAIDWEGKAEKTEYNQYLKSLAERIYTECGAWPLIYVNMNCLKNILSLSPYIDKVAKNCGLWVANWTNDSIGLSHINPWTFCAMRQFTNSPFDQDYFYGTHEQLQKYGVKYDEETDNEPDNKCEGCGHRCCCHGKCVHDE